jgi:hypothetical protein
VWWRSCDSSNDDLRPTGMATAISPKTSYVRSRLGRTTWAEREEKERDAFQGLVEAGGLP